MISLSILESIPFKVARCNHHQRRLIWQSELVHRDTLELGLATVYRRWCNADEHDGISHCNLIPQHVISYAMVLR